MIHQAEHLCELVRSVLLIANLLQKCVSRCRGLLLMGTFNDIITCYLYFATAFCTNLPQTQRATITINDEPHNPNSLLSQPIFNNESISSPIRLDFSSIITICCHRMSILSNWSRRPWYLESHTHKKCKRKEIAAQHHAASHSSLHLRWLYLVLMQPGELYWRIRWKTHRFAK